MLTQATRRNKIKTTVTFDATKHRNRYSPAFAAGLAEPTRWTGQHDFSPFTVDECEWATQCFRDASAAEIDAEEDAYNAMLEQLAFEDAAVGRLSRGHCL